jgi:hypothetical protein
MNVFIRSARVTLKTMSPTTHALLRRQTTNLSVYEIDYEKTMWTWEQKLQEGTLHDGAGERAAVSNGNVISFLRILRPLYLSNLQSSLSKRRRKAHITRATPYTLRSIQNHNIMHLCLCSERLRSRSNLKKQRKRPYASAIELHFKTLYSSLPKVKSTPQT